MDVDLVKVLTNIISNLEKLHSDKLQAHEIVGAQHWNLWDQLKIQFKFRDFIMWFPKGSKTHLGKFTRKWFGPYKVQYNLPNNTMLLVIVDKFDLNPKLVNVNKLKPSWHMEQEE
jgi:hypothetical protein